MGPILERVKGAGLAPAVRLFARSFLHFAQAYREHREDALAIEDGKRKLAAILAADVVAYSRLMEADEIGTLARLKSLRLELIDPGIAEHGGRIVKLMGDGLLAEFPSVVDAVRCAVELQRGLVARGAEAPEDERMAFRMGINLGDVIVDGDDIHGDGVNVAARLEALAEPDGLCISGTVHDSVEGKLDIAFGDGSEHRIKNIARPVRVWRWLPDDEAPASRAAAAAALPLSDKPSIAVLPFDNLSGDPEQDYFCDGVTEDIITALSRIRWFFVIARNSVFAYKGSSPDIRRVAEELGVRYVIEGSVRKAAERVRVTAQLIDGPTGKHVWAQRYDRELADIFAVQDEITETIVGAIEPELGKAERERAKSKKWANLDAWDVYQQGLSRLYRYTMEDLKEARTLFRRAIEMDPDLAPAYSGLAESYYYEVVYGFAPSVAENREKALEPARRAVEIDDEDAAARCTLGRVHYLRREHETAILELEVALDLNPSLALAHYGLGAAKLFSGRAGEALPHIGAAIRLSPHDPNMGSFLVRLADAHFLAGEYEAAVDGAKKALRQPSFQWSRYAVLLSALGHLGRLDEARGHLESLLRKRPDFSLAFVRETHLFGNADDFDHFIEGLRKAGVPD